MGLKSKILSEDDSSTIRKVIKNALQELNDTVPEASSGRAC